MPRHLIATQRALVEFRMRLNLSQQALADELQVTQASVARWETYLRPNGIYLYLLATFARISGQPEIAAIFENALRDERPRLREWEARCA
jgi:transcriptional regulator with XRE-family HTH domain